MTNKPQPQIDRAAEREPDPSAEKKTRRGGEKNTHIDGDETLVILGTYTQEAPKPVRAAAEFLLHILSANIAASRVMLQRRASGNTRE